MQIREFFINGFGIFHKLHVPDIAPGLNVFFGNNEAGKSTILAYLRAIFFGFETGRARDSQYKPLMGGEYGGAVTVEMRNNSQPYRIERRPGRAQGIAAIQHGDAPLESDEFLQQLLPGVTKGLYKNIFAFSLDELQNFSSLTDEEVRARIYSYGAGTGQVSAIDVEQSIKKEMTEIFAPRAHGKSINRLLSEIADTETSIRDLRGRSSNYDDLHRELERLETSIAEVDKHIDDLRLRVTRLEQLQRAWDDWVSLISLRTQIADLPEIKSFPEDGVGRLDRLNEKKEELTMHIERLHAELMDENTRLDVLVVDHQLIDARAVVEGLMQELGHFESAFVDLPRMEAEASSARSAVIDSLRTLGDGWTKERALQFDTSVVVSNEIRQLGEHLKSTGSEMSQAVVRREEADRTLRDRLDELKAAKDELVVLPATSKAVDCQEEAMRNARSAFSSIRVLEVRRCSSQETKLTAERQLAARVAETGQPSKLSLKWVGIAFGVALLILAGARLRDPATATLLAVVGAATVAATIVMNGRLARSEAQREKRLTSEMAELNNVILTTNRDLEEIAKECEQTSVLLRESEATISRPLSTEQELNSAEAAISVMSKAESRRAALGDRLKEKQREAERATEHAEEARARESSAQESAQKSKNLWMQWLDSRKLVNTISPDTALDLLSKIEVVRNKSQAAESADQRVRDIRDCLDSFEARASIVLGKCNWPIPSRASLAASVRSLRESIEQATENARKREGVHVTVRRLDLDLTVAQGEIERVFGETVRLLDAGNSADEEEFRRRASQFSERSRCLDEIKTREQNLVMIGGSDMADDLHDNKLDAIQADLELRSEELNRLQKDIAVQREDRGKVKQRLDDIEKSDELSTKLMQEESLRAKLGAEANRWAVRAIGCEMLQRARQRYELEKQPRVVQAASEVLRGITDGTYERVFSPLGQEDVQLETPTGQRKAPGELSRGTREQLYLSLRFGLIQEYNRHAEPLPVIMDDILVNFDPARSAAAAQAILRLSQDSQVLFFTCHPETLDLLLSLGKPVARFDVRDGTVLRR